MADVSSLDKLRDLYMPEHNLSSDDLNRSNIVHQQVRRQNEDVVLRSVKQSLHDADLHYLSPVLARMRQHQQQHHEEHIQPLMNVSQASPRTSWMEEEDDVEPMLQDGLVMDGLSQHRRDVAVMEMMKLHAPDVLEPVSPAYSQRMNESTATAAAMLRSTCRVVGGDVAGSDGLGTSSLAAHRNVSTPVGAAAPLGDAPHTYAQLFANNNASIHGRSTPATSSPRATAGGVKKHMSRLALKDLYTADVDEDEVGDATTTWEEKEAMEVLRQEQTNRLVVSSSPPPPIREDDGTFTAPSSLPTSQRSADVVVECSNTMMMSGGNLDGSMNLQPRKPLWLRHSLPRHAPQQAQRASVGGDTSSASMMMEMDAPFSATLLHRGGSTFNCTTEDLFLTQLNQSRLFYSAGSLPPIMAAPLMEGRQRDLKVLDVVRDSMSRRGPISSSAQRRKHR